jgi:putative hydrolase of the HAD superfamily
LPQITALFWDVGGVLLTNAWDRDERAKALERFGLDPVEFGDRHEMLVSSLERGKINLKEYLERTIFYRPRSFTPQDLEKYMFSLSQANFPVLDLAKSLAASGRYLMGIINNESKDLNEFRIQAFGLKNIFSVFVSSCYVGYRKPEDAIYQLALEITQKDPAECCFIDDRPLNLDAAAKLGMHTIRMENVEQLQRDFEKLGVAA